MEAVLLQNVWSSKAKQSANYNPHLDNHHEDLKNCLLYRVSVVGGLDFLEECQVCYRLVSMEGCVISAVVGHPSYEKLCVVYT